MTNQFISASFVSEQLINSNMNIKGQGSIIIQLSLTKSDEPSYYFLCEFNEFSYVFI